MRIVLLALTGMAVLTASAASTYVLAQNSHTAVDSKIETARDAESDAHESATAYVVQEFPDNEMERMRLLGYEDALHMAMKARSTTSMQKAARILLRAQSCNGFLGKGHHTTVARDAILYMHHAEPSNPQWRRIIAVSSELPSEPDGDPCVAPEERMKEPSNGIDGSSPPVNRTKTRATGRSAAYHVQITPEMRRLAESHPDVEPAPVRMHLD